MTRKTKRVIISIIILVLLAATYGYYLYNKGPLSVVNSTAIKINADDLYQQFSGDPVHAIKKYAGEVLAVSGMVESFSSNQQNQMIILLKAGTDGAYINCTMEENPAPVTPGSEVTIKGICSGIGEGDDDLGIKGDVYLARCYTINE